MEMVKGEFVWPLRDCKPPIVLTGTQVYGPARLESDIDIAMMYYHANDLQLFLERNGLRTYQTAEQEKNNYPGYYFGLGLMTVNIICTATPWELESWRYATEKMMELRPIKDRAKRIGVFENFRFEFMKTLT
jgi:hypothetical protein